MIKKVLFIIMLSSTLISIYSIQGSVGNIIKSNVVVANSVLLVGDNVASEQTTSSWLDNIGVFFGTKLGVGIVIIVFLILLILPFLPALKELTHPKDNKPLLINQDYIRNPKFFSDSFKEELKPFLAYQGSNESARQKYKNRVPVDHYQDLTLSDSAQSEHLLIVSNNLKAGQRIQLRQPVYVKGNAEIGNNSELDILMVNGDITLGNNCSIVKWMSSDSTITVGTESNVGKRVTCDKTMLLNKGCLFSNLYAMPIASYEADFKKSQDKPPAIETSGKTAESSTQVTDYHWFISKKFISIPPYSVVNNSMIVKSDLILRQGVVVNGDLKVYGKVMIEKGVRIYGELISDSDIEIGEDTFIKENLFTQAQIYLKSGVRIGLPGQHRSAIGKKGIKIERNVLIYGNIMTAGKGIII